MSDPVLTFIIIACFFAAIAAARWFKTLDAAFMGAAITPIIVGIACGILMYFAGHPALIGIILTIASVYVRHVGHESEATDGMLLGAMTGAAAALPLAFSGDHELRLFAQCVLAASIAGYGITFAAFHVADRGKQLLLDVVTAAVAVGGAYLPIVTSKRGISDRQLAIAVAILIPLISVATVFRQWRSVRAELSHEASLGFMDGDDIRVTAHPILRLGRGGWTNPAAHREFVRLSNKIALRKRQQRNRPDEVARLYQLEIIKLRMQVQEMSKIDRDARAADRMT